MSGDNVRSIDERADAADRSNPPTGYPFRALGYDAQAFYFLPHATLQVHAIPLGAMTSKSYLLALAPLEWYEAEFPTKGGADWTLAGNQLMRWCEIAGYFAPTRVRGRGAWYDAGATVLHLGSRLVVDGTPTGLTEHRSSYVYEAAAPLEVNGAAEPAAVSESSLFRSLMDEIYWSRPIAPVLVAGWSYLAPICGALAWRPHVWITGQRGSGKSYVIEQIIRPLIGPAAAVAQASTTEAGIRQTLGHDARPVLFDEAEGESRNDHKRVQGVIELARQASSENSAEIIKGTATGKAMSFRVRSMFLLGSINVTLAQAADVTRFTICQLQQPPAGAEGTRQFASLQSAVAEILTPQYCERLRARAYDGIPTIRANAATLSTAVAEHLGDQRIGDQVGTLLAGAYHLRSDGRVSLDGARRLVQQMDWSEEAEQHQAASDQDRLISELLAKRVRIEAERGAVERTVGELVEATQGRRYGSIEPQVAREALERCGMKVAGSTSLRIANQHPWIRNALCDTPWSGGWRQILSYIPGAVACGIQRVAGQRVRCTAIPLDYVVPRDGEDA